MTIQQVQSLFVVVVVVGLLFGVAGMFSGCAGGIRGRFVAEVEGEGGAYAPYGAGGYASRPGQYGYGGYGSGQDHFRYVPLQYAGTIYDQRMAGAIRPPPPVPVPPAPAGPAAPASQGSTDPAALRTDVDAVAEAVIVLNQRVLPLEDMHCRRHPRTRRCRQGGGQ